MHPGVLSRVAKVAVLGVTWKMVTAFCAKLAGMGYGVTHLVLVVVMVNVTGLQVTA
jgi:hypothetical protein